MINNTPTINVHLQLHVGFAMLSILKYNHLCLVCFLVLYWELETHILSIMTLTLEVGPADVVYVYL